MSREYSRTLRIDAQLQRELADLVRRELADPRVVGVTITRVDASPDLRNAAVRVSMLGSDAALDAAVGVLNRAAPRLRHFLGKRLRLRLIPELRFAPDRALREGDRVVDLIRAAVREDAQARGDGTDPGPASA